MIPKNVMYYKNNESYEIPKNLIMWTSTWYITQWLGRTTHANASADTDLFTTYRLSFCDTTENTVMPGQLNTLITPTYYTNL